MDYPQVLDFIYGLQKQGIKLGLERINLLLGLLSNPHHQYPSIHIAGTNGKGSVSAIISTVLSRANLRTGLFTSPHILSFTERIRIDGDEITEQEVIRYALRLMDTIKQNAIEGTTFFEFVTALAMLYFEERSIQCGVFETGMGGRLDATNVLMPKVSVITRVGLDHREFLGDTLSKIAFEKAGIIKKDTPVVVSPQSAEAMEVLTDRARELRCPLYAYGKDFKGVLKGSSLNGVVFDYSDEEVTLEDLFLPLLGTHQVENAATAIKACRLFLRDLIDSSDLPQLIREALMDVSWPGRLQWICHSPAILIDGAHNPEASGTLANFIGSHLKTNRIVLVIGVMSDKDAVGILSHLLPLVHNVVFTSANYERAMPSKSLAEIARSLGFYNFEISDSVADGIDRALSFIGSELTVKSLHRLILKIREPVRPKEPVIIITGSFYVLGEALEAMGLRAVMGSLRETVKEGEREGGAWIRAL